MDEAKAELVGAWLKKALHDLVAARLLGTAENPVLDIAIYHCQQAAEKALKGFLAAQDQKIAKTHDVGVLIEKAAEFEPGFGNWIEVAERLTPYATAYRYPENEEPTREEFDEALEDAETIYRQVLAYLPEDVQPKD